MGDRLDEYRRRRDAGRTPEPVPEVRPAPGRGDTFVIQQHHARSLHWDLRLERDGVFVSWAVPRGIPRDPRRNHLAVHTEDHPLEYGDFRGEIPAGEYGGGRVSLYDRGTYETEKWHDDEVVMVMRGRRVSGRYALFQTRGKDWMIHRMDPPEPGWVPMPEPVAPMRAVRAARLPPEDGNWAYELRWDGARTLGYVSGGRLVLRDADGTAVTACYPELRELGERLAPVECALDGVIVAFDPDGQVSPAALSQRTAAAGSPSGSRLTAAARRLVAQIPVQYLVFDLLWVDGQSTVGLPYARRRELLDGLALGGPHWQQPPNFVGGGPFARDASRARGSGGLIAKRLDSPYLAGRRSRQWLRVEP
jgi:bifunctional non-homologous end joining protein LigD